MSELDLLISGRDESVTLDVAALELAKIEFPDLDVGHYTGILDSMAEILSDRLEPNCSAIDYVCEANEYLFEDLKFRGNQTDYYDPYNSCLNHVLTERTGIPITICLVYMEISRRLGRPVYGIGLPGHFIAQYNDGLTATFIDCFNEGKLLSADECYALATEASGIELPQDAGLLDPVGNRQILQRMLNNLRAIYFRRQSMRKAKMVVDLLIGSAPDSAEEYKQRAVCEMKMQQYRPAKADFEKYLQLAPKAEDRGEIEGQLNHLRMLVAALN